MVLPSFNSIKVRLRLSMKRQAGTITRFQFHKGAIKTDAGDKLGAPIMCFNSIKVRLRRIRDAEYGRRAPFQFHKGAIKTDGGKAAGALGDVSIP